MKERLCWCERCSWWLSLCAQTHESEFLCLSVMKRVTQRSSLCGFICIVTLELLSRFSQSTTMFHVLDCFFFFNPDRAEVTRRGTNVYCRCLLLLEKRSRTNTKLTVRTREDGEWMWQRTEDERKKEELCDLTVTFKSSETVLRLLSGLLD